MPGTRLGDMVHTYVLDVPDEDSARALAADLTRRGHRFVRVEPHEGRRRVRSLVDEEAPDHESEDWQAMWEAVELDVLARRHGGYRVGSMVSQRRTALHHHDDTEEDAARAHAIRREVLAGFPPPVTPPEPTDPLSAPAGEHRPLFDVLRSIAPTDSWWRTHAADGFGESGEIDLVFEINDAFMHQGTCYDHTAGEVPLIAALAADEDVHPALRATLVDFLFLATTVGRRLAAEDADRRVSLGLPLDERDEERAAREAVEASAPALLERWDEECEAVRFSLVLLGAACPGAGGHLAAAIRDWAASEGSDSPRGRVLGLAAALAGGEPGIDALVAGMVADGFAHMPPGPGAPAVYAAFGVLAEWAEKELSAVLEGT